MLHNHPNMDNSPANIISGSEEADHRTPREVPAKRYRCRNYNICKGWTRNKGGLCYICLGQTDQLPQEEPTKGEDHV